ncbi:MAG TPA: glycoside hydrolase family 3 C-terminal domain-containing protein [Ilumatobacter sp.]
MTPFQQARQAVAAGESPRAAAAAVVAAMTRAEQLWCLDGDAPAWAGLEFLGKGGYHEAPFHAAVVERVGMPGIAFSDGPRGVVIGNATCFPVSMARGATWDPELEERIGDAIGRELRASGATLYGGVCVNLLRHPAWGRAQETYGEDPHHVGEMGAALTRGIQRHAMATVKHFAANSMENARFYVDVEVDDEALHEVYLPHFRRIVDEGVACVMSAYNHVNGACCGDSRPLLTDVLRGEWGFDGFVVSDWIFGLRDAAASLHAGLDIEMPYRMVRMSHLADALAAEAASWDEVAAAVTNVVATLLRFDAVLSQPAPPMSVVGAPEHVALAREVAARSVVLLRNEPVDGRPVLPFDPATTGTIAVLGELADRTNLGDGGSSDVYSLDNVTALAGIRAAAPAAGVSHDDGADLGRAAATAAAADVAVVVVGYTAADEGEFIGDTGVDLRHLLPVADEPDVVAAFRAALDHTLPTVRPDHVTGRPGLGFTKGGDRASIRLRPHDVDLIRAVAAVNDRTVVAIGAGSAVVVADWDAAVPAIVQAWYGGQQAGHGLADVLFGTADPSARLPFTVPTDESHLPPFDAAAEHVVYDRWHGWWRSERDGHQPAYPFGFGLSYTTFELGGFDAAVDDDEIVVTGSLANTGDRDGADVVQVYATLPDRTRPRRLVGFGRVSVAAGAVAPVEIRVPVSTLATRDGGRRAWVAAAGRHHLRVARFATDPAGTTLVVDLG